MGKGTRPHALFHGSHCSFRHRRRHRPPSQGLDWPTTNHLFSLSIFPSVSPGFFLSSFFSPLAIQKFQSPSTRDTSHVSSAALLACFNKKKKTIKDRMNNSGTGR
ncbi:hypothetical protein H104_04099 [Trichophyton rubrum CBS 289.86]|nr:hypothetical protein H104_04099 [Trichophyton rubrum CBS 289.86]